MTEKKFDRVVSSITAIELFFPNLWLG